MMIEEAKKLAEAGDYRGLALLCLKVLEARDWGEGWAKASQLAEASREYVILKFLASAYILASEHSSSLTEAGREFLARDLAVCVEKILQIKSQLG